MYITVAIGYCILGYLAGRERWQQWIAGYYYFITGMLLIWGLHATALYHSIFTTTTPNLDVTTTGSLLISMSVAVYMIGQQGFWGHSKKEMYRFWNYFLPFVGVISALPALWSGFHPLTLEGSAWIQLHWWIGLLSIATLIVATIQATWLTHWGHRLKQTPAEFEEAPSLLALENALFIWIWISFILLSITVGSGILFSEQLFGHPFQTSTHRISHKVVFTWITWLLVGWILWKRHYQGIRGHTVAQWLQWSSGMVIVGYLGTKFVLEIVLKR